MACGNQPVGEMRADKPSTASNKNFHVASWRLQTLPICDGTERVLATTHIFGSPPFNAERGSVFCADLTRYRRQSLPSSCQATPRQLSVVVSTFGSISSIQCAGDLKLI